MARRNASEPSPLLVAVATLVGAAVAGQVARLAWRAVTGQAPPQDPTAIEEDTTVAVMWAVVSAAMMGVTRVLIKRRLAVRAANAADEQ